MRITLVIPHKPLAVQMGDQASMCSACGLIPHLRHLFGKPNKQLVRDDKV